MKKNGYGVNVKETTSHLQSDWQIKQTSRDRHMIFNKWEIPHHAASPKWSQQKNQVDKSVDTILHQFIK